MLRHCLLPSLSAGVPPRQFAAKSRPRSPLHAQPINSSAPDRGAGASSSSQADLEDDLEVDPGLDLAANSWPRIVLDEPKPADRDGPFREAPLPPGDQAKFREMFLLRLATLGFAVRLPLSEQPAKQAALSRCCAPPAPFPRSLALGAAAHSGAFKDRARPARRIGLAPPVPQPGVPGVNRRCYWGSG